MATPGGSLKVEVAIDLEEDDSDTVFYWPGGDLVLCEVCYGCKPLSEFIQFSGCGHQFCSECVRHAFQSSVMESRVSLQCLQCKEEVTQHEIQLVLDAEYFDKYLNFTLRRFLASQQPHTCYCQAPDCSYACINSCSDAQADEVARNHFVCRREGCGSEHCNSCKREWHPGKTCEEFEGGAVRGPVGLTDELKAKMGAKNCPSCNIVIEKTSDGSCNQVVCAVCQTSFCWLCGKQVTEMHYMSPTGCPLYGSRMWTKKKRWCCRLWLWILAPLLTLLLSLVMLPVVLIVFPLGVGYKVYKTSSKISRNKCHRALGVFLTTVIVTLCILVAPLVAFLAALLVFPLMLLYFYCFIPIHVCMQSPIPDIPGGVAVARLGTD